MSTKIGAREAVERRQEEGIRKERKNIKDRQRKKGIGRKPVREERKEGKK